MVKPLVDYPDDDDDEDVMDTKPEALAEQTQRAELLSTTEPTSETSPDAAVSAPSSPAQTPPPERLAEKRRREEEDDDELMKLTTGPKRRSSTSSNSSAGILSRKKSLSIAPIATEKSGSGVLASVSAAPKRIAINLGPTKPAPSEADTSCTTYASGEASEKENRDDSKGEGDG